MIVPQDLSSLWCYLRCSEPRAVYAFAQAPSTTFTCYHISHLSSTHRGSTTHGVSPLLSALIVIHYDCFCFVSPAVPSAVPDSLQSTSLAGRLHPSAGCKGGIRTPDQVINSHPAYQLAYLTMRSNRHHFQLEQFVLVVVTLLQGQDSNLQTSLAAYLH